MYKTIEQKYLKFKEIALIDIAAASTSMIFAVFLAYDGYGVYALVYSALLQFILMNISYFVLGVKKYGLNWHYRFDETRPFLKIGMYQVGGQVVNYFNRDLDILIIGKFFSSDILGGYSLAKQLVMRPMQVINPIITKVASPTLAKFQDSIEKLKENYLKLINIVSTVNFPIYLLFFILAPWVVLIFYGKGFENIVVLVRILSIYMLMRSVSSPVGSLVIATGRTDYEFYWNLLTLLVTPMCILIGTQYGIEGAALGITLSILLLFFPAWKLLIYKMTHASFKEYIKALFILNLKNLTSK